MKDTVYYRKGCSVCSTALDWLDGRGNDIYPRPIMSEPPTKAELTSMWQSSGQSLDTFFNPASDAYKNGDYANKLPKMTDDEKLDALAGTPDLIQHPILTTGKGTNVGFNKAAWEKIL